MNSNKTHHGIIIFHQVLSDKSVQYYLDLKESATGQADSGGGPLTALNASAGAHPNYSKVVRWEGGACAQILGKCQL